MAIINLHNYEAYLLDYFEGNLNKELESELKVFVITHPELQIDLEDNDLPVFTKEEINVDFKNELFKTREEVPGEDLLNYIEGNLSSAEKSKLEKRLSQDRELAGELELLKKTVLVPEYSEVFSKKEDLVKTEDQFVLNNSVIAYFEKTLSREETLTFEKQLASDKSLRDELSLVQKTKLTADNAIVYPGKEALKKEARVIALFNYRFAVAAAVLLVFGLAILFIFNKGTSENFTEPQLAKKHDNKQVEIKNNNNTSEIVPQTNSLIANKAAMRRKKNVHSAQVNTVAVNSSTVLIAKGQSTQTPVIENNFNDNSATLANNLVKDTNQTTHEVPVLRYTNIDALAVADDTDDDVESLDKPVKHGFWKRAVKLAQQMNGLGVKAVKGDEKENENYSLSFNSFSVERK